MGNIIISDEPIFSTEMTKVETTTPVAADLMNKNYQQLLNNDAFLKALGDLMKVHLENAGLHVTAKQKDKWDAKAETALATNVQNGLMSAGDKDKIDTVQLWAEANQNAYSNVKVGGITVDANGKTATIELVAGNNVTISGDNNTKRITIAIPSSLPASGGRADYADTAGNADKLLNKIWNWSGQAGQPLWLWGGSDGTNMYVYNPANFSVASAATINGQPSAPVAIQATAPATNYLWVW